MKTCKNCNTLNELHTTRCISCNMENYFSLHASVEEPATVEIPKVSIQCQNCGEHQLAEETHCTSCRFPLAEVKVKTISSLSAKLGRKVS